jgi:hypothetical protein
MVAGAAYYMRCGPAAVSLGGRSSFCAMVIIILIVSFILQIAHYVDSLRWRDVTHSFRQNYEEK